MHYIAIFGVAVAIVSFVGFLGSAIAVYVALSIARKFQEKDYY